MNQQIFGEKISKKWFTLPPSGRKVTLPPSNKGEQEIFRDVKGCNWIQNGIKHLIAVRTNVPCDKIRYKPPVPDISQLYLMKFGQMAAKTRPWTETEPSEH